MQHRRVSYQLCDVFSDLQIRYGRHSQTFQSIGAGQERQTASAIITFSFKTHARAWLGAATIEGVNRKPKQVSFRTHVPMRKELGPISQSLACPTGQA